jgi:putative ABC transport system permease protein
MEGWFLDLRQAFRGLLARRGFTAAAALTLALSIGAATTMFSVVNEIVLRPLDYHSPRELVFLNESSPDGAQTYSVPIPNFLDWRERNRSLRSLSAFRATSFNLTGSGEPLRVRAAMVSANFFETLGVAPILGRGLRNGPVAILSHGFWQRRFGGRTDALGASLVLDGRSFTVAGVMPPSFEFLTSSIELWVPIEEFRSELPWSERGSHPALWVVGRLAPGVDLGAARADMDRIQRELDAEYSHPHPVVVTPLHERVVGRMRPALSALSGSVLLLLLVGCVNVANLLLARASTRSREMATRVAMGASRARILSQLLTESLLLALIGGALGILIASWGIDLVARVLPASTPRVSSLALDGTSLVVASILTLATGALFGLAPLIEIRQSLLAPSLRASQGLVSPRRRFASTLVVTEVALAVVLLVGTAVLLKSFSRLASVDPGFRPENRLVARLSLPPSKYETAEARTRFYRDALEALKTRAGIDAAAVSTGIPLVDPGMELGVVAESSGETDFYDDTLASLQMVSPGYFRAMGVELLRGRVFEEGDDASSPAVAVIDESFERRLFAGTSAIGRRISLGGTADEPNFAEVVGVVRHVLNYRLSSPQYVEVYVPLSQPAAAAVDALSNGNFVVVYRGTAEQAIRAVRETVLAIDPGQPIYGGTTMGEIVDLELAPARTNGILSAAFASAALALAGVGLYGVLAGLVSRRTREIGLRMALGASPRRVLGAVLRDGLLLTALGAFVGVVVTWALGRLVEGLGFETSVLDPDILAASLALVTLVSLAASAIPARRAARTESMEALRTE